MSKAYLKKIIARSAEDLQIISACCSEGKVKINDIKYLKKNKIFLIYINRIAKEIENSSNKLNSIIRFEYIQASKSKNIDQKKQNQDLELISIDIFKKNNIFEITLLFMDNKIITLTAEIIEVTLEDQKNIND
ncbi:MAG: DUF2948 family protein [Candidatus Pelagibacterales bacterium]|jgi:hypothetical protein|nr:hypothetical protein [Candidatus Pelagibacter sp.]RZO51000.1 MAG: DUF2948 family protein [Pelagibacterales bacterium]|tara:strand:- start:1537 stop:1935 length:399 start_codon:yes stop_codon:yes gene_type:complete